MSMWDHLTIGRPLRDRGAVLIAAHEDPPPGSKGLVKLDVTDDVGSATLALSVSEAKQFAQLMWEAACRAEWYQLTQRTL